MKKYFFLGGFLILAGFVYFTGLYTYFMGKDVQEALPMTSLSPGVSAQGSPRVLKSGNFVEVDFVHKGSGTAKLVEINGTTILRFENFNVTSGSDLYVYLTKSMQPTGDLSSLGDYRDLGLLKGTSGNQNYEINADIGGYQTSVVWCKRFGVLFTYAVMQ